MAPAKIFYDFQYVIRRRRYKIQKCAYIDYVICGSSPEEEAHSLNAKNETQKSDDVEMTNNEQLALNTSQIVPIFTKMPQNIDGQQYFIAHFIELKETYNNYCFCEKHM